MVRRNLLGSLVLVLAGLGTAASVEATTILHVDGPATAMPGDVVSFDIGLDLDVGATDELVSALFSVEFDSAVFSFVSAVAGDLNPAPDWSFNAVAGLSAVKIGTDCLVLFCLPDGSVGTLAMVTLSVHDTAPPGATELKIPASGVTLFGQDFFFDLFQITDFSTTPHTTEIERAALLPAPGTAFLALVGLGWCAAGLGRRS